MRWWTYQRERFPLAVNLPFCAVLAVSILGWTTLSLGVPATSVLVQVAAGISALFFFLQLRVADEFKDADDDRQYRPERPVPRGLVTLRQLGWVGALAMALQATFALLVSPWLLLTLLVLWTWWALMAKEFFVKAWLKAHPVAYLISHMVSTPLLALHISAFAWLHGLGPAPPPGLLALLAMSFFVGLAVEVGRKTWSPDRERRGVETYTSLWGVPGASAAWLAACVMAIVAAVWAAGPAESDWLAVPVGVVAGLVCVAMAIAFVTRQTRGWSKAIEATAGILAFLLFAALGLLPRFWRPA